MQKWIDRVTHFLSYVSNDDSIEECARYLGMKDDDLIYLRLPEGRRSWPTACSTRNLPITRPPPDYLAMRAIADFLQRDLLTKLIQDIAFVWVNMQAARQLQGIYEEPGSRIALLNALSPLTAYDYIDRGNLPRRLLVRAGRHSRRRKRGGELVADHQRAVKSLSCIEPPLHRSEHDAPTDGMGSES